MTQQFMDGFDHYGTGSEGRLAMLDGAWAELSETTTPVTPSFGARTGSAAIEFDTGTNAIRIARRVLTSAVSELIISMGNYLPNLPDVSDRIGVLFFVNTSNESVAGLFVGSDGTITARGNTIGSERFSEGPLLAVTAGPVLVAGTWQHVEARCKTGAGTGELEVRVDEVVVLTLSSQALGVNDITQIVLGNPRAAIPVPSTPTNTYADDLVVRDTAGSLNNDFQGDLRVATLQPIANGVNQGWTPRSIQNIGVGVLNVLDAGSRNSGLTFLDDAALEIGSADYAIEGFFRFAEALTTTERYALSSKFRTDTDERSWLLELLGPDSGGVMEFKTSSDGTLGDVQTIHSFPFVPDLNRWYHIAVTRSGSSSRMFIDGAQVGITQTDSRTYDANTSRVSISGEMSGSNTITANTALDGWVDGFRITIGDARYTSNFTPPTSPLPVDVAGDPLYNSVALLLNFDNDAVTDQSVNAFTGSLLNGAAQEVPNDEQAFQTIDGTTPNDFDFVEASLTTATGTLTFVDNPLTTETVTLGSVTYNFQAVLEDTANNVLIGATAEDSLDNLLAAVNLQAGAGTIYGAGTVVNPGAQLTDLPDEQVLATASTPGLIGNSVVSTVAGALGIDWVTRTSAADNSWFGITFGAGLFVAVALSGTGNRVMTSPDGITWTIRTSAADNDWDSVTFGAGLFVAVALSGTGNRVMTSPDGITWTIRTSAADNGWRSVTFGAGLFVAVANGGVGNRVMTSPDGITWTIRTSAADNGWFGVTFGAGLFVAVAITGTGNRVMTSPDGITWTIRTSAADNGWRSVTFGAGLFVAVAETGTGNRVMTSPDGITWTIRTSAADNGWRSVTFGAGLFVAVANGGVGNRVMTSPDGITWTIRTSAADNSWNSVAFGGGLFVAVAFSGVSTRVMSSGAASTDMSWSAATLLGGLDIPTNSEFTLSALPADATGVRAVAIVNRAFKTDSGPSALQASFVEVGGASSAGSARPLTVDATYYEDTFETDPSTAGAITPSTLSGSRIRINRTT